MAKSTPVDPEPVPPSGPQYPKWVTPPGGPPTIVESAEAEAALCEPEVVPPPAKKGK